MSNLTNKDLMVLGATQLAMFVVLALTQITTPHMTAASPLPMMAAEGGGFREFINSVIYLVGGGLAVALAVSIGARLSDYVFGQFNKTGVTIPSRYNMFSYISSLLGTLFVTHHDLDNVKLLAAAFVFLVVLVMLVIKMMDKPREEI